MWNWLTKIFHPEDPPSEKTPPWAREILARLAAPVEQTPSEDPAPEEEEGAPSWATELTEITQKSNRAQAKTALRLEEVERKLEAGLDDLRQRLQQHARPASLRWDDLLDSMDALEEAARALRGEKPEAAEGLVALLKRLERFASQGSLTRHSPHGSPPDGRLFRVVGTESNEALPDGVITRVIRAAVKQGEAVLREGEVLTNQKQP